MAKTEVKAAKLASRETNHHLARVYSCPADGSKMLWVQYFGQNGRGRTVLRCDKCGAIKGRSEL